MLRVGLVGLGGISKYYLSALQTNPELQLKAVCDIDPEKLQDVAVNGVSGFTSLDDFLANSYVDAVIITLPNYLHHQSVRNALTAGLHVLVEKPLTTNVKESEDLVRTSEQTKRVLFTAFHRRYNRNFEDLIENPTRYGRITSFKARYLEKIEDHSADDSWYLDVKKCGGGCVIDNGINVIDLLSHILGPLTVEDSRVTYDTRGIDMQALITFGFAHGHGTLELDWAYAKGEAKDVSFVKEDGFTMYRDMLSRSREFKGSLWHEYERLLKDFAESVKTGRDHGEKGLEAQKTIANCYARGESNARS